MFNVVIAVVINITFYFYYYLQEKKAFAKDNLLISFFFHRCEVCQSLSSVTSGNWHDFGYDTTDIKTNKAWCQVCDMAQD